MSTETFDLDVGWRLDPQVSIRPERFGALLYHFGTRRLSFVKTPMLLRVLQLLASCETARTACRAAGVAESQLPAYRSVLGTLAGSAMIRKREAA